MLEALGIASVSGWFVTVSIVTIILYLYSKLKLRQWKNLGIPGPEPTLYMGNLLEYMKKGFGSTDLGYVQKYGKVVGTYACHQPNLLLTDPDMIKEVFIKQFPTFTNRNTLINPSERTSAGLVFAKDMHWKFLRSTMSPTFTSGKLKLMMEKIQNCCKSMVDNIEVQRDAGKLVDMKEICGSFTMDVISSTAFGIDVNSQKDPNNQFVYYGKRAGIGELPRYKTIFFMMFQFLRRFFPLDLFKKDVTDFFTSVIQSAVTLRQEGKKNYKDFLQLMLNARHVGVKSKTSSNDNLQDYKNRGLNQMEIEANSVLFFIAGYDTTANSLSFASYCLAIYPDFQQRVVDEIDTVLEGEEPQYDSIVKLQYLDRFFSEVMRLYGAVTRFGRECTQDITVKDTFIPKGTGVTIPIFALHRDPKYWPDPERFDPDRFTEENKAKRPECCYLPFGIGQRVCIGQRLALMEAKMALVYLLQNFTFSPSDKTEIPVKFGKGGLLRAANPILLRINRRKREEKCC